MTDVMQHANMQHQMPVVSSIATSWVIIYRCSFCYRSRLWNVCDALEQISKPTDRLVLWLAFELHTIPFLVLTYQLLDARPFLIAKLVTIPLQVRLQA